MKDTTVKYVFPETERKVFIYAARILCPLELLMHGYLIGSSVYNQDLDGVWISFFFCVIFGVVHFQNLRYRKYCLAKWSFNETAFTVYIKDQEYTVDVTQAFCVATTTLTFSRRYKPEKYPFIMIWKPGDSVPYEDMGGYFALKKRDALIVPYNDETLTIFKEAFAIHEIPRWPKSRVCFGISANQTNQ